MKNGGKEEPNFGENLGSTKEENEGRRKANQARAKAEVTKRDG